LLHPQNKIVSAQQHATAKFLAQLIDYIGQALLSVAISSRDIQGQSAPETALINIGKLK